MVWHLTNALGGIKLQVGDRDIEEALAILAESEALELPAAGQADGALPPTSGKKQPWELGRVEVDEPGVALTSRDRMPTSPYGVPCWASCCYPCNCTPSGCF